MIFFCNSYFFKFFFHALNYFSQLLLIFECAGAKAKRIMKALLLNNYFFSLSERIKYILLFCSTYSLIVFISLAFIMLMSQRFDDLEIENKRMVINYFKFIGSVLLETLANVFETDSLDNINFQVLSDSSMLIHNPQGELAILILYLTPFYSIR